MLEIYRTENENVLDKTKTLLAGYIGVDFEIKHTENGKPFIEGNPLYFSVSHSGNAAVIAICDKPVGIDLELYKQRSFRTVLSRFTQREQSEIDGDLKKFYTNWVVKEAFIKMRASTLARDLKRLEYFNKTLYFNGVRQECNIQVVPYKNIGICAVCLPYGGEIPAQIKLFAMKRGEKL